MDTILKPANGNTIEFSKRSAVTGLAGFRTLTSVFFSSAAILFPVLAHADVKISSGATANMTCSGGVCSPTAKNAILNVTDLENLLATGNVTVTTTGSGVQAKDIALDAPLSWSSPNALTFDANQTILIENPVTVTGQGGLLVTTNDGGKNGFFGFRGKGQVKFSNLSSALTINGATYTLAADIAALASDIAANPTGNYALAGSYDASGDGIYQSSPIPTQFDGNFEGLGNTISHLSIDDPENGDFVGLFAYLDVAGKAENLNLQNLDYGGNGLAVGGMAGVNLGSITAVFASGTLTSNIQNGGAEIGGLAGDSEGSISRSGAVATIGNDQRWTAGGGLVGAASGNITQSYADCTVSGGDSSYLGGLIGSNGGLVSISQSYAKGKVGGGTTLGGLIGFNATKVTQTYSTTTLQNIGRKDRDAGGLIGKDEGRISSSYWDTSTSRIKNRKKGAGTPRKDPGIKGLTAEQLQSGLPDGFDPKVWAEDPKINNGLPYLIDNPPRKD
jgi:hypothetical protein